MKKHFIIATLFAILAVACKKDNASENTADSDTLQVTTPVAEDENTTVKTELTQLIRKTIHWAGSDQSIDLLPTFPKDSICTGFDKIGLSKNLIKLRSTGFFSSEFIDNYAAIINTLDEKIKNKQFEPWDMGELPTFSFVNDVDPWCMCQDDPGDWNAVRVGITSLKGDSGEFFYYFGDAEPKADEYSYKFNAVKENGKWKISYMCGFDYKMSVKADGEL